MKKIIFLTVLVGLFAFALQAQPLGNEWITNGQAYLKIKIAKEGIFRITPAQMFASGVPAAVNPSTIQVFVGGKEQFIYVKGQADGILNPNDYIDFYGQPNDGLADTLLYSNRAMFGNPYVSFFTDTASYYLTWGVVVGKRIQDAPLVMPSGTPESSYKHEEFQVFKTNYYRGEPVAGGRSFLSYYQAAEGWFGPNYTRGNTYDITLNTPNAIANSTATLEAKYYGNSTTSHELQIQLGTSATALSNLVASHLYSGHTPVLFNFGISTNLLGNPTSIFRTKILSLGIDNNTLSYLKLIYPRNFDLQNTSSRKLNLTGSGAGSANNLSRISFQNYNKSTPIIYDITNNLRLNPSLSGTSVEAMVGFAGRPKNLFLIDDTDPLPTTLETVALANINPALNYNYIIISHEKLAQSANSYANYRRSPAGGNHNVLLVNSNQLYDLFAYGIHTPIAIRNFIDYLLRNQSQKPQNLLLLGKGYSTQYLRQGYFNADLVPTIGVTSSDNMLTYGLDGTLYEPAIPLGRVAASTNQEVQNYLNKVIQYESTAADPTWQKNVLNLSGAYDQSEKQRFSGYLNNDINILTGASENYRTNLELGLLSAKVSQIDWVGSGPNAAPDKPSIINQVNGGLALLNYFGHGGRDGTFANMGKAAEYSNTGKYPVMYFAGCRVGDPFGLDVSPGQNFTLEPQKGAIVWIAGTDLGYEGFLRQLGMLMSNHFATVDYGSTIGLTVKNVIRNFQTTSTFNVLHSQQNLVQGDPAIRIYSFLRPDFEPTVIFTPNSELINANLDSFRVCVVLKNMGKSKPTPSVLQLKRTTPNGNWILYNKTIATIGASDTIVFWVDAKNNLGGLNNFEATVDANQNIIESNESNNTISQTIDIKVNGVRLLTPYNYAIVPTRTVALTVQNVNPFSKNETYQIELDTTFKFNSAFKRQFSVVSPLAQATISSILLAKDSTVYFWRAKLPSETTWKTGSFTYMSGSPAGWNQSNFDQFTNDTFDNLTPNTTTRQLELNRTYDYVTASAQNGGASMRRNGILISNSNSCGLGIRVFQFDSVATNINKIVNTLPCGGTGSSMVFDITTAAGRQAFENYLRAVPNKNYLALTTLANAATPFLKLDSIPFYLSQLGVDVNVLFGITNSTTSFSFVGQKGTAVGQASQSTNDEALTPNVPSQSQYYLKGRAAAGTITSEKIGPSTRWKQFSFAYQEQPSDSVFFTIIGIDINGNETILADNVTSTFNLSTINASNYPYLKIRTKIIDQQNRSAVNLTRWTVLYDGIPETTVLLDNSYLVNNTTDSLKQNDSIKLTFKHKNISNFTTDSLVLRYYFTNNAGVKLLIKQMAIKGFVPQEERVINFIEPVVGYGGGNLLTVSVLPRNLLQEEYLYNNSFVQDFTVKTKFATPTPVELLYFDAKLYQSDVLLQWATAWEQNNDYFLLQRRTQNESEFKNITQIKGKGNTAKRSTYKWTDNVAALDKGLIYYRLKQVDFDGNFSYSPTRTVNLDKKFANQVLIYPIPATSEVNLKITVSETVSAVLTLTNVLGEIIRVYDLKNEFLVGIENMVQIPVDDLPNGQYFLTVNFGEEVIKKQISIQK